MTGAIICQELILVFLSKNSYTFLMKTIVIHFNPDLDAITGAWIIKRFLKGWKKAEIAFVPAGELYQDMPVDSNPEILHVDTGLGELDHHQTDEYICAAQLCHRKTKNQKLKIKDIDNEALERLCEVVCEVDHGRDISWPDSENDRYLFFLEEILGGLNSIYQDDGQVVEFGLKALDGIFKVLKDKIKAEEILEGPRAIKFETRWGRGVGVTTENEAVLTVGEKMGYSLVVKKDSRIGNIRIYARWDRKVDLTKVYQQLKELDSEATWFLHASKCLLLNGSTRNPKMKPTKLSLQEIIAVLK